MSPHPFVLFQREGGPDLFDQVVSAGLRAGFSPKTVAQLNAMQAVLTAVGSGLGVPLAPACSGHLNLAGGITRRVVDVTKTIALQFHFRGDQADATIRGLCDAIHGKKQRHRQNDGVVRPLCHAL
ncbi:LysR substrate-binding domain-containing protein [Loktanella sp. R86503]|uniref:LysR substrate-binding domain-containing protein n=1 Tax=Loktanella sp. R86503 TaxID=3093847 RepID=UPI0036DBB2AE